jgi:hypothetical protein
MKKVWLQLNLGDLTILKINRTEQPLDDAQPPGWILEVFKKVCALHDQPD